MVFISRNATSSSKRNRLFPTAMLIGVVVSVYIAATNIRFSGSFTFQINIPSEGDAPPKIDNSFKVSIDHGTASSAISIPQSKVGLTRDPGDPQPPHQDRVSLQLWNAHNRLMVIPEYKLVFCYIEKVGCSMFNQLFRLLRIYHPSLSPEERKFLAGSHFGRANPDHFNLTIHDLTNLINDDQWTKAVFFRDPADRFLSGFKSKCGGADSDGGRHCRQTFGETNNTKGNKRPVLDGGLASFHQSIDLAANSTRKVFSNPHFKPATQFCGGLGKTIDKYSFVHMLDKKTVGAHVKTLFHHLGVDPTLTEDLLERVVKTGGILHPIDVEKVEAEYGLHLGGNISGSHSTAKAKLRSKEYFQSPEMLKKLQDVYKGDYEMFQLEPPGLDEL